MLLFLMVFGFFFPSQSETFGKKLSNLHLAVKKSYEEEI